MSEYLFGSFIRDVHVTEIVLLFQHNNKVLLNCGDRGM